MASNAVIVVQVNTQNGTAEVKAMASAFSSLGRSASASARNVDKLNASLATLHQQFGASGAAAVTHGAKVNQAGGAQRKTKDDTDKLTTSLKHLAAAFLVGAATSFIKDSVGAANALEKTEATVRALSGSQQRYNDVLGIARRGQQLYGDSLQANLSGLGSLVNLSNRTGASLANLDNVSRRLAIVDPLQGIEGANIALKEFLTGTGGEAALSLARRFELPRLAIAALAKEGTSAKERLAGLDALLNQQGITNEVLTNRTKTTAAAYDQLNAAASNAQVAVGNVIAEFLRMPAERIANNLNQIATALEYVSKASRQEKEHGFEVKAFTGADNFTEYGQRIQFINDQLAKLRPLINDSVVPLTQVQYEYAQALVATGKAADEAVTTAQKYGGVLNSLNLAQGKMWESTNLTSDAILRLKDRTLELAATSDANRGFVEGLNIAYASGRISIEAYQQALSAAQQAQLLSTLGVQAGATATDTARMVLEHQITVVRDAALATRELAQAQGTALAENIASQVASDALKEKQKALVEVAQQVADATALVGRQQHETSQTFLQGSDNAVVLTRTLEGVTQSSAATERQMAVLTQAFGGNRDAAEALVQSLLKADAALAAIRGNVASGAAGPRFSPTAGGDIDIRGDAKQAAKDAEKRAKDLADAQKALAVATGGTSAALRIARQELGRLIPGTADYINKQAEVIRLTKQLRSEQEASAKKLKGAQDSAAKKSLAAYNKELKTANQIEQERLDLLDDDARLTALQARLARGNLTELDRLKLLNDIKDTEKRITQERERQLSAALGLQISAIQERRTRREEARRVTQAQRVLAKSRNAEQRAYAEEELALIPLEQQQRYLQMQGQAREAGVSLPGAANTPVPALPNGVPFPATGTGSALLGGGGGGGMPVTFTLATGAIQVFIDGREVEGRIITNLRGTLQQARSAGISRGL